MELRWFWLAWSVIEETDYGFADLIGLAWSGYLTGMFVCMYVYNIYLVSAPLRGFSVALKGCPESVPNNSYFLSLSNRYVSISCFEKLLFAAIWTSVAAGRMFHAIGPAAENPRLCMDEEVPGLILSLLHTK